MIRMSNYFKEVLAYPKEKKFEFVRVGMSQWRETLSNIEKVTESDRLRSIDFPLVHDDANFLDLITEHGETQFTARSIAKNLLQLAEIAESLKTIGSFKQIVAPLRSGFSLEESMFSAPVGVVKFKVGNLSGRNWNNIGPGYDIKLHPAPCTHRESIR